MPPVEAVPSLRNKCSQRLLPNENKISDDWRPADATEITLQAFRRVAASALNADENFTLTGFEATFRRALHVGLQFSVTGGYHVASYTFINGGQPRTDDYIFVQPGLFYRFTDRLQAGLIYQYRRNSQILSGSVFPTTR